MKMNPDLFCDYNEPILKVIQLMNKNKKEIVFIMGRRDNIIGVISEGDTRRFLLKNFSFYEKAENVMNRNFVYATKEENREQLIAKTTDYISIIPIVDESFKVVDIFEYRRRNPIPLSEPCLKGREFDYLVDAFLSTWISSSGKYIELFESKFSKLFGDSSAVATNSGTSALHITLVESKIGRDDEVIVPTITFISPINTVKYVGAEPVFMDCDDHLNLDIAKVEQFLATECDFNGEKVINKKTKRRVRAIIPVHVFGNLVDMEYLMDVASRYNLTVIEDATEALGSYFKTGNYKGKQAGVTGDYGCFSFNGNKIITTGGGGMVITKKKDNADHIRYLVAQAKDDSVFYKHNEIGYNFKMTNLTAALGVAQLENLLTFVQDKRKNFNIYAEALDGYKGLSLIKEPPYSFSNHWFYSLVVDKEKFGISRDQLLQKLLDNSIQSRPVWYPNHLQKPYLNCQRYCIEKANWYYDKVINIPCSSNLSVEEIKNVIKVIKE
jgi:perosamine synthetase